MTAGFDRAFVAMGVDANELSHFRGRTIIYIGLVMMAVASTMLAAGIAMNIGNVGAF